MIYESHYINIKLQKITLKMSQKLDPLVDHINKTPSKIRRSCIPRNNRKEFTLYFQNAVQLHFLLSIQAIATLLQIDTLPLLMPLNAVVMHQLFLDECHALKRLLRL